MLKFFQKNKGKLILLFVIVFFVTFIISMSKALKQQQTKEEEKQETLETYVMDDSPASVSSPEITTPTKTKTSNGKYIDYTNGYSFNVPEGFSVYENSDFVYLRNESNDAQIAVVYSGINYTTLNAAWDGINTFLPRLTISQDGEEVKEITYSPRVKKEDVVEEHNIQYESGGEITFYESKKTDTAITKKYSGEVLLVDNVAVYMFGTSNDMEISQLEDVMRSVTSSISSYECSEQDLDQSIELATFTSDKADATSFTYPADWTIKQNDDGMISIKAPRGSSSPYSGTIIEFYADENNQYVEDYAQFASNYEKQLLLPYFVQKVSTSDFAFTSSVTSMNTKATIGEKECIYFEVIDTISPKSTSIRNSMPNVDGVVQSKRYTYKSNDVDCVINFIYTSDKADQIIEKVINSTSIY